MSSFLPKQKRRIKQKPKLLASSIQLYTRQLLRRMQKFYLVGITGRTSFILQSLKGTKYKITIGNQISCSCKIFHNNNNNNIKQQNNMHCIHTLYVLTEIFFLQEDNGLLNQVMYSDKDLRYIIANRRIYSNRISDFLKFIRKKQKSPKKNQYNQANSNNNSNNSNNNSPSHHNSSIIMQQQDEDDMQNLCAICHMQIVKSDATTSCTNVCRNTFHLDCFSQWMKYELKNNGIVKCPLCRDQKTQQSLLQIKVKQYQIKDNLNNKKVGICYNYYCDGCMLKEIEENKAVYKCVTCEDVTLCETCFVGNKHIKHSFICKPTNVKKWKQCEDRKIKKKQDADQGFIRMKLPTYKRLYNFLACVYPSFFSKNNRWNVVECKKLDIKLQQLQCMMCSDPQKSFLRKLPCGHFIHHKCLRKRIQKGKLYCKHQGMKFLVGYQSLLKQQQLNKKVQFQINAQLQQQQQQQDILQKSGNFRQSSPSHNNNNNNNNNKSPYKNNNNNNKDNQNMTNSTLLNNSKTLKSLNMNNQNSKSTSCDSRRKRHGSRSKQERNKSLVSKFRNQNGIR